MTGEFPQLSANPLALVRSLPTRPIPLDQIRGGPDREIDEIFHSKYASHLIGKAPIHETRVPLRSVRRGFWKRTPTTWTLIVDPVPDNDLAEVVSLIRLGYRPVLFLYENPNPADDKRFVSADDVAIHAAYEHLGIAMVPVALMGKPRDLPESSLTVRQFKRGKNSSVALLLGTVPVEHKTVPSILGLHKGAVDVDLESLQIALSSTQQALKEFHQPGAVRLHYHHTLYSVLLRANDTVSSMRLLVRERKPLVAAGLLRSLYELVLVFYIDWLSPGQIHRYLQMASVTSEKEWEKQCEEWRKRDIAAGSSAHDAEQIKQAHMRAFRLGCVVGERARMFPLGDAFHKDVYRFLSDIVHHDYSMTARYAHTLDHGDDVVFDEDVLKTLVHLSDILIAAIVSRIDEDIGRSPAPLEINQASAT